MDVSQKAQPNICKNFPSKINNPWNPVFQYGCWAGHQFPVRSTGMLALALSNKLRLIYWFLMISSSWGHFSFAATCLGHSWNRRSRAVLRRVTKGNCKPTAWCKVWESKLLVMMDCLNGIYLLSEIKISGLRYQVKGTLGMTNMGPFVEVHCSGPFPSYVNRWNLNQRHLM